MSEVDGDYLWDRSGAPDLEVEELESLLSRCRYRPQPLRDVARPAVQRWRMPVAIAAAAIVVAVLGFVIRSRFVWSSGEPWQVVPVAGSPRIAGAAFTRPTRLALGQVLETDATSHARLKIASIGLLDVEPGSRLRLLATRTRHHRVALDFGTVRARIWAPPFSFGVQTPSSLALDLGCAFTLHVQRDGQGLLRVTSGWVELQQGDRQTIIPADAEAITRPRLGPGTVYFADAPDELKQALARFDTNGDDRIVRGQAIAAIIAAARSRDAITLLSLLHKLPVDDRSRVLDRLTEFVPIPAGFDREDIMELQTSAMDAYWRDLGLGNSKSWILNWKDALFQ